MSSQDTQPPYFQPQDNHKTRSKKKSYKYTDEEFSLQPSLPEKYKPNYNKYNANDFSFEDRSKKIYTPKNQAKQEGNKFEAEVSPIAEKEGSVKKNFDQRINKIQNLNDKISSLLKMVPKVSQPQYKMPVRNYAKQNISQEPQNTPRSKQAQITTTAYTPYRKVEEITNKSRKSEERKKNYSYLDQIDSKQINNKQPQQEQEAEKAYFNSKYQTKQSPISKYRHRPQPTYQQPIIPKLQEPSAALPNKRVGNIDVGYKYQHKRIVSKYKQQIQQNKQVERKEKVVMNNNDLDIRINHIKNKIFDSPIKAAKGQQQTHNYYEQSGADVEQPTVAELAHKLSKLIDLDIILRKIRQSFEQHRSDKKWDALKAQLKCKNIYIQQKQLRQILKISIHQKNPFGDRIEAFPLNGVKDLAKIFAETEAVWNIQLDKVVSLDSLAAQRFQMAFIDINRKGNITIEDLVCFVNVHSQKFYRSRDVAQLFRRFLDIEGKKLQKNIGQGISYATFMNKVTR